MLPREFQHSVHVLLRNPSGWWKWQIEKVYRWTGRVLYQNSPFYRISYKDDSLSLNLRRDWPKICNSRVAFDWPEKRWKYDWASNETNATMLYNVVRLLKPKVLVETGTFEGHGTIAMARAAHENNNNGLIITIDYDDDPTAQLPREDWLALRKIREDNLNIIRRGFPNVEVRFINGDSREVLSSLFPKLDYWDFFFQDSMHFMEGILAEWEAMQPFARKGAVVVFDDISLRGLPLFGRSKDFCSWFIRHETANGWICMSTEVGHRQFWAQKVR